MKRFFLMVSVLLLVSCANIEHSTKINEKLDTVKFAGIGDLVLSIDRERNLENALGKSDVFGRKTKVGYTEIRFAGVEPNGTVVLYRKDVSIISNETTMSRTPFSYTSGRSNTNINISGKLDGNQAELIGRTNTGYTSTTISQAKDYHIAVPADTVAIRLQPSETFLPVSGYLLYVESKSRNSLKYRIEKQ